MEVDTPHRADQINASPPPAVNAFAFDSSLLDKQTTEAMRSLGLGPSFESNQIWGFMVVGLLSLYILLCVVSLVSDFSGIQTLSKATGSLTMPDVELTAIDSQVLVIRFLQAALVLLTAVAFLAWIYRAHKNLKPFGAMDLKYSPGWAIIGFFIPFLNIVRPYQVVTEIWKASGYETWRSEADAWKYAETPIFIAVWWGSWLTLGILDSLGAFTILGALGTDQLLVATRYRIVYYVVGIASAALAITVVLKINARQERTNRLIWLKTLQDTEDSEGGGD